MRNSTHLGYTETELNQRYYRFCALLGFLGTVASTTALYFGEKHSSTADNPFLLDDPFIMRIILAGSLMLCVGSMLFVFRPKKIENQEDELNANDNGKKEPQNTRHSFSNTSQDSQQPTQRTQAAVDEKIQVDFKQEQLLPLSVFVIHGAGHFFRFAGGIMIMYAAAYALAIGFGLDHDRFPIYEKPSSQDNKIFFGLLYGLIFGVGAFSLKREMCIFFTKSFNTLDKPGWEPQEELKIGAKAPNFNDQHYLSSAERITPPQQKDGENCQQMDESGSTTASDPLPFLYDDEIYASAGAKPTHW
jgi:hypothetical protein